MNFYTQFVSKHKNRTIGLDLLRAAAILLVVFRHGTKGVSDGFKKVYEEIQFIKLDGVTVFFVLSGFLIGQMLIKIISKNDFCEKDLLHFWIRRWFRTIPNYVVVLLFLIGYTQLTYGTLSDFNYKYFFFLQNFFSTHPGFFPEAWSLAVEEWFYLLFPFITYLFIRTTKNKTKSFLIATILFAIIPFFLRAYQYHYLSDLSGLDSEFRKVVLLRLDSIIYGVIASILLLKTPGIWAKLKTPLLITGLLILILLYTNPFSWKTFYPPLFYNIESLTIFCFLPILNSIKKFRSEKLNAVIIFVSIISYSMYLLHLTVIMDEFIPRINFYLLRVKPKLTGFFTTYLMYWFFTITGAYLLYHFFEHPVTQLRDKFNIKR